MATYVKKEVRKEQIKQAAMALFVKHGYRGTSVQDILDEINYSKSGFYNCYASKEELFKDILNDGMAYRYAKIKEYKKNDDALNRKEMLVEALLDKLIDYNEYKPLFSNLMIEMGSNQALLELYKINSEEMIKYFIEFCKKEGFEEYIKVSNKEFGIFINSLIIGTEIFNAYDDKAYREMLKTIITAYFYQINLFEEV